MTNVILLFILAALCVIMTLMLLQYLESKKSKEQISPEVPQYIMTDDQLKDFKQYDVDAVQSFRESLQNLNAFMTGNEEDAHAEQQDI